jgi:D-3-phosphoglycerate dehydrogenase
MAEPTVVVTSRSFGATEPTALRQLADAGLEVVRAGADHRPEELAALLPHAVAWIAGTAPVDARLLALGPRLRVVARYGIGVDAVDLAVATERGIWVTNTPGANAEAVADLAVGLVLDALRSITVGAGRLRAGDWSAIRGRELGACDVGLVGLGRIGQAVARRLQGFGARVSATDPGLAESAVAGIPLVDLDTLAATSDVISLHLPGGAPLVDERWLGRLRPGAVLVNTARADLVDEAALAAALADGRVAAYAADTLAGEHGAARSPLLADDLADRVLVTPHLGAQTEQAVARMTAMATANVLAVLAGEQPPNPVNAPTDPNTSG